MKDVRELLEVESVSALQHLWFNLLNFRFFKDYAWRDPMMEVVSPFLKLIVIPYILSMEVFLFRRMRLFVKVRGYVAGIFVLSEKPDSLYISSLAVAPEYRGLGIAKFMLNYAERMAVRLNKNLVELAVSKNNLPAIRLYGKFGFTKERERRSAFVLGKKIKPDQYS